MSDHATTLSPARRLALYVLLDVGRRDAFARDVLNANASLKNLDERDAGFTRRLPSALPRLPGAWMISFSSAAILKPALTPAFAARYA